MSNTDTPPVSNPVLRWHGGKWRLAPWIVSHFPEHRGYTEVFGGGASVLLRKPRVYAEVYNDLDLEVVTLFSLLRDPVRARELIELVELTPFSREELRVSFKPTQEPMERARRLLVRSFQGFGSQATPRTTGFRGHIGKAGTHAASVWRSYPPRLTQAVERLRGVIIENRPAVDVLREYDAPDVLHYVDPPYVPETRDEGGDYAHEMTAEDHHQLGAVLRLLKGMVVLSGYAHPLYDEELFKDWHRVEREALADGGRKRVEVLWMNDAALLGHL